MKVLIYGGDLKRIRKSGIGVAIEHLTQALSLAGVEWTREPGAQVDLVDINTFVPTAHFTQLRYRYRRVPIVFHAHTTRQTFLDSFALSNWMGWSVERAVVRLCSAADQVICPSHHALREIKGYGVKVPAAVISNGVDTQRFRYDPELGAAFLRLYGLRKPLILSVALPFRRKGVADFCEIAAAMPDYTFVWLGARLGRMLPRDVQRIVSQPPANVLFPGYVPDELIVGAYSACDVFFFPSYTETEGIVVLEASSTGRAIVLRNIPVYQDWMHDGVNCRMGENNEEFARLIEELTADSSAADGLGAAARLTAEERDLHMVGRKLKALYEGVLERRRDAASA